jgi:hypothetical protein
MKTALIVLCWSVSAGALVYAVANPNSGVAVRSPLAAVCLGLIGLGVCLEIRHRRLAAARAAPVRNSPARSEPVSRG